MGSQIWVCKGKYFSILYILTQRCLSSKLRSRYSTFIIVRNCRSSYFDLGWVLVMSTCKIKISWTSVNSIHLQTISPVQWAEQDEKCI